MKRTLLRLVLILDAGALLIIGGLFMAAPAHALVLFGFTGVPANVSFIVGTFGAVYASTGIGYVLAAQNPLRNVAWVQVAITRGAAESLFSIYAMATGLVTMRQAGFSIVFPALIAVACLLLYPTPQLPIADTDGDAPVIDGQP